ncbi:MAG: SurA N-terminal domain-containing protein [Nitrospirota bacterium]|nr:SurA N-terminal domain-containing protein [Nitrospirota bacterium]
MLKGISGILVVLGMVAAVPAQAGIMIDRVVAVVNDDVVTMSDLQKEVAARAQETLESFQGKELEAAKKRVNRDILNLLVERHLQLDLAKRRGVGVSDDEVASAIEDVKKKNEFDDDALAKALEAKGMTLNDYRKTLREEITVNKLVYREVKSRITVTDSEITEHYKANKESFSSDPTVTVKHVLVSCAPEASAEIKNEAKRIAGEVMAKLRRGDDFASVIGDYAGSRLPVSGNDLGTVKRGDLIQELDTPAFALKVGEVSEPVQMADGYHVIKIIDRSEAKVKPLDEVKAQIGKHLFNQKSEEQYYKWLKELRTNAFVEIKLGE